MDFELPRIMHVTVSQILLVSSHVQHCPIVPPTAIAAANIGVAAVAAVNWAGSRKQASTAP